MTQVLTEYVLQWHEDEMINSAAKVKCTAQDWKQVDFTRYSINQKEGKLDLPTKVGWALYEGDLTPFVPYLEAGKYLHVGENTTIGFGHYDIYYDEEVR